MTPFRRYLRFSLLELLACVVLCGVGLFAQTSNEIDLWVEPKKSVYNIYFRKTYGWPYPLFTVYAEDSSHLYDRLSAGSLFISPRVMLEGIPFLCTLLFWTLAALILVSALRVLAGLSPQRHIIVPFLLYILAFLLAKFIHDYLLDRYCIFILHWCWLFLGFALAINVTIRRRTLRQLKSANAGSAPSG